MAKRSLSRHTVSPTLPDVILPGMLVSHLRAGLAAPLAGAVSTGFGGLARAVADGFPPGVAAAVVDAAASLPRRGPAGPGARRTACRSPGRRSSTWPR